MAQLKIIKFSAKTWLNKSFSSGFKSDISDIWAVMCGRENYLFMLLAIKLTFRELIEKVINL